MNIQPLNRRHGWSPVFHRCKHLIVLIVIALIPESQIRAAEPDQAIGSHELTILNRNWLEMLAIVGRESGGPAPDELWNFADPTNGLSLPAPSAFQVTVNGNPETPINVGFRRRTAFANLDEWDLRLGVSIFLELGSPIPNDAVVSVTSSDPEIVPPGWNFTAAATALRENPAIHANQEGYGVGFPKQAAIGYFVGTLGELPTSGITQFELRRTSDGATVFTGTAQQRLDYGFNVTPIPYQSVLEVDFSSFDTPGEYVIAVDGWGASVPFRIDSGIPALYARSYALGMYHQRSGAAKTQPHTRFTHGADHTAPAQIPDTTSEFSTANSIIAQTTSDYANEPRHTAPQLTDVDASLYPFVNTGTVDVSGGHFDAGDYSKYTTNSADMTHILTFAVDNFPGVAALDNLGLPESGDGIGDLLQELKWEADFLAKMQDADGGFYFLVYPKARKFEDNVMPEDGDPQIVWPKNTLSTAAATAALAEVGSSPAFQAAYPTEAALYLQKAQNGWNFLMNAIATHGYDGSYQKLTHYGIVFLHDDELAWAAAAMYAATGDITYQNQLFQWFPDPNAQSTRRWSWWRLFAGYGNAVRTYAFAARSGRLNPNDLAPGYLSQCETEIQLAGDDQVQRALDSAYGTSFPTQSKLFYSAGWYFSASQAFDIVVADLLTPDPVNLETTVSNLNYELGVNPINRSFITGVGARQQTEIVNHIDMNHRRVLPPTGLPIGSLHTGFSWISLYGTDISAPTYPTDSSSTAPYPLYDRWGNVFNTTSEPVVTDIARCLGVSAWLMAQTNEASQPWTAVSASINGLPSQMTYGSQATLSLSAPGLDLTNASIVWETAEDHLVYNETLDYSRFSPDPVWIEAEAYLPDGRRVVASAALGATTAPPQVDAGPDQTLALPQTATTLDAVVSQSGGSTPAIQWQSISGPAPVTFASPNSASTLVYYSQPGVYQLQIEAQDGGFTTTDALTLTVQGSPTPPVLGDAYASDSDTIALYHFDGDGTDASGSGYHLNVSGATSYASDNLTWMASPAGQSARFHALGDTLAVPIPDSAVLPSSGAPITIDAWIFVRDFLAYGQTNAPIISLEQQWDTSFEIMDRKWDAPAVPRIISGQSIVLTETEWASNIDPFQWYKLTLVYDGASTLDVYINGEFVKSGSVNPNFARTNDWDVTLGNFDGDIDEVRISSIQRDPKDGLPSDEFIPDIDTIALYHFNGVATDETSNHYDLQLNGAAAYASDNLGWMDAPTGDVLRLSDLGDSATVTIPDSALFPTGGADFTLEARVFVRAYKAYSQTNAGVISLYQEWDSSLELLDRKWNSPAVPRVSSGQTVVMTPADWENEVQLNTWYHLKLVMGANAIVKVYLDDNLIQSAPVSVNDLRTNDWTLTLGNFDGDIDEVRVSSIQR